MTRSIMINPADPHGYVARGEIVVRGVYWRIKADKFDPSEAIIERNGKYFRGCVSQLPEPVRVFWREVVQAARGVPQFSANEAE